MVRYCRLFNVFKAFSCKIGDPHVFSGSGTKVAEGFPLISNFAVTARIKINYSRAENENALVEKSESSTNLKLMA